MQLPVMPPVAPMLAKPAKNIPAGMHYEGKWDGFRAIIFRDGDEVEIGSRNERPLTRYFPEVVEYIRETTPTRFVADGELIIVRDGCLDFDALLNRIHPAESRVNLLAQEIPADFVAFDLLALGDDDLMNLPFEQRRAQLESALAGGPSQVHVAPATRDLEVAQNWFVDFEGAGLDGLIVKALDGVYEPNKRTMIKIKHERTADCVVAGFRWHKTGPIIGSLLLGLYDDAGALHSVGVSASFTMQKRAELVEFLTPYIADGDSLQAHPWRDWAEFAAASLDGPPAPGEANVRMPGALSRWNAHKDLSWIPLRPELVVEVGYDHMQGTRFRHTAKFRNWRPDRDPRSCTYDQLEIPLKYTMDDVLGN